MSAKHHVNPRGFFDNQVTIFLGQTTTNCDLEVRVLLLFGKEGSEVSIELVIRVLTDGAGVEDHNIRLPGFTRQVTSVFKQTRNALRVVSVHLTAVGSNLVAAGFGKHQAYDFTAWDSASLMAAKTMLEPKPRLCRNPTNRRFLTSDSKCESCP